MSNPPFKSFILASGSPRRSQLLSLCGLNFKVIPAQTEQRPKDNDVAIDYVMREAWAKAKAVSLLYPEEIILAADTIVVLKGNILGKPQDPAEAKSMLKALSGQTHEVITAFHIIVPQKNVSSTQAVKSEVIFRKYSDQQAEAYLLLGESMDKAGAYAVQGRGIGLISKIIGSITNVMGLPLEEVLQALTPYL